MADETKHSNYYEGVVEKVLPLQTGVGKTSGKEWKKQPFTLLVNDNNYEHEIYFEIFGEDRISKCPIVVGDKVKVSFDTDCREWQGRYFTTLTAWKVESIGNQPVESEQPQGTGLKF